MPAAVKFLIGLAAALAVGLVSHGPMGRGAAFIDGLDQGLQAVIADAAISGVSGTMQREPLARTAIMSGQVTRFQREGQGSLPGLDERILAVPGIGRIEWTGEPS
jgi:hypothetical protein